MKRDQLKAVKTSLALARQDRLLAEQQQSLLAAQVAKDAVARTEDDFRTRVGAVAPLRSLPRVPRATVPPEPVPRQRMLDEQAALRSTLSDPLDVETLLDTDEALSFCRPHVGVDVARKLRRGHWALQAEIDLHGLTRDSARDALAAFLVDTMARGLRCVRVVHGKGIGSPGRVPVLKGKVRSWLMQSDCVLAFVQAPPAHGGHGAVLVLLSG